MSQDRRNFIRVTSIASVSFIPVIKTLAQTLGKQDDELLASEHFNTDLEFHIIDNNLLNLHFYFINVKQSGNYLEPKTSGNSFMIIRLPQMHVSERGFWNTEWRNAYPDATLSGYSYLAFQLWPELKGKEKNNADKKTKFDLDTLLDWNNKALFSLITLAEWFKLKKVPDKLFDFAIIREKPNPEIIESFKAKKVFSNADIIHTTEELEPKSYIYRKYKNIILKLFNGNLKAEQQAGFIPVTLFEVPESLFLVPINGRQRDLTDTNTAFWKNEYVNQEIKNAGYRKYEVWNNTLFFKKEKTDKKENTGTDQESYEIITPSFRVMGIKSEGLSGNSKKASTCLEECAADSKQNYLPSLLDKADLAFLTQYAKKDSYDFTQEEFDIREVNGFFFTGLGIITHLKYYNADKCPVEMTDLIEYEHIITEGRDIFIKVARLGYNSKTGQRYKHVIEGKRKIESDPENKDKAPIASFIELKQYCECIDKHISYEEEEVEEANWHKSFSNIPAFPDNSILKPVTKKTDHKRNIFKELTVLEKKRIPINCLGDIVYPNNVCELECLEWFWPVREEATTPGQSDKTVSYNDYLLCEYEAKDWEGKTVTAQTPFMFIRASFISRTKGNVKTAYDNYFKGNFTIADQETGNEDIRLIERRKTFYNSQAIALAPSAGTSDSNNKTNIIETEFTDNYFRVKDITDLLGKVDIKHINYVVFPQTLRLKVYPDHIRDLTQRKIPSVFEYHDDYIEHFYTEYSEDVKKEIRGNGAKLILGVTEAFHNNVEEPLNNTNRKINQALQEAKDKLGNLVTPDIFPDTISLEKLGITAPKNLLDSIKKGKTILDDARKIESFNPRELLRGKLSDVCGLDLTAILDEVIPAIPSDNQTPLFELSKTINRIETELTGSAVYQEIKDNIENVKNEIAKLENAYAEIDAIIKQNEAQLSEAVKQLNSAVPNSEELANLTKNIFDQYKLQGIDLLSEVIPLEKSSEKVTASLAVFKKFLTTENELLQEEFTQKKKELNTYFDDLKNLVSQPLPLPAELQFIEPFIKSELLPFFEGALDFTDSLNILYSSCTNSRKLEGVYFKTDALGNPTWELSNVDKDDKGKNYKPLLICDAVLKDNIPANIGFVQYRNLVTFLETFILKNINGTSVQIDAAKKIQEHLNTKLNKKIKLPDGSETHVITLFENKLQSFQNDEKEGLKKLRRKIELWRIRAATVMSDSSNAELKTFLQEIDGRVNKLLPYIDFLKKTDPYYYYTEQQRLAKEIIDIESRFKKEFFESYISIRDLILTQYQNYKGLQEQYLNTSKALKKALDGLDQNVPATILALNKSRTAFVQAKKALSDANEIVTKAIRDGANDIVRAYITSDNALINLYNTIFKQGAGLIDTIASKKKEYKDKFDAYFEYVKSEGGKASSSIIDGIENWIKDQQDIEKINEARNLIRLLTSIKQQDLTYKWDTTKFRDINLGIVSFKKFSNPNTQLMVDVKSTTFFSPGIFPPHIEKITTYSENRFLNFGVSFFNSLTITFDEVSFITGSDHSTHFDVKIKDVQFGGALSFVQAFEQWLQTMGKGLILQLHNDHVSLGYSLPIPNIQTPAFSFFNLSLNLDLRIHFDKRPMRVGFSLARPDSKFGIAAGIYAGFGFFSVVADTRKGIVEIDCALEAGAWQGIKVGPMKGEVKLAFGFRYTRNELGVRLEGYIVAEGRLSVWIIEVSARIYLGIVSENSYVEGVCTVTYSVKVGIISKSFSGSFHKKIAGASNQNQGSNALLLANFAQNLTDRSITNINALQKNLCKILDAKEDEEDVIETHYVSEENWKRFINIF